MLTLILFFLAIMIILSVIASFYEKKNPELEHKLISSAILSMFIGILLANALLICQIGGVVDDTDTCIGTYQEAVIYETEDNEHYYIKWNHFIPWRLFEREYIEIDDIENKVSRNFNGYVD